MLNEYFNKWCCIIVVDHISVHGRPESSLDDSAINRLNSFVQQINCNCHVYTDKDISSDQLTFFSFSEAGSNLVENAFRSAFEKNYRKVILLDAKQEVSQAIIVEAFSALKLIELCLGPKENGCYLLGMNFFDQDFFIQLPTVFLADKKALIKKAGELHLAIYKTALLKDMINSL